MIANFLLILDRIDKLSILIPSQKNKPDWPFWNKDLCFIWWSPPLSQLLRSRKIPKSERSNVVKVQSNNLKNVMCIFYMTNSANSKKGHTETWVGLILSNYRILVGKPRGEFFLTVNCLTVNWSTRLFLFIKIKNEAIISALKWDK